ncbi:MAG: ABC transporter ATP-binding protein [Cellvibrionaceae bacterium]
MTEIHTIAIKDLRFSWPKTQSPIVAIDDWQLRQGQRLFLYGRSGSGKSTLLNLIAGILEPQEGSIAIDGHNIVNMSQRQRDQFRAKNIGIIFQQFNLIPYLSVTDNIRLGQTFSACDYEHERLLELVKKLDLNESVLLQQANQLSVGQQQRVAVIRALYHRPKLIIADEPTSALDAETRDEFIQLLLEQSTANNSTVLFVSHDKNLAKHFDQQLDLNQLNQTKA